MKNIEQIFSFAIQSKEIMFSKMNFQERCVQFYTPLGAIKQFNIISVIQLQLLKAL